MKAPKKLFIAAALFAVISGCTKNESSPVADKNQSLNLIAKAVPENPALSERIYDAVGKSVFQQYGVKDFKITSIGEEEIVQGMHMFRVGYATKQGNSGSALIVKDGNTY